MIAVTMENYFNAREVEVAKSIINISLANAAASFSKLARQKVLLQHVSIPPVTPDYDLNHIIQSDEKLWVLITEVRGDLPAESYLVFTPDNAAAISQLISGDRDQHSIEYQEAILLEVDNILTASVVTQFSNFFQAYLYGDVPGMIHATKSRTEEILSERLNSFGFRVSFKTCFITENLKIYPEFIWIFTIDFINAIKDLASRNNSDQYMLEYDQYLKEYVHWSD